ncbi:dirigent protein 22-like [Nymphaea colorata]|nr:dirigent protein 22-like [Nymphaea colorata]
MGRLSFPSQAFTLTVFLLLLESPISCARTPRHYSESKQLRLTPERVTRLHFFFHDTVSGRNPTAVQIASAPSTAKSLTRFGFLTMMDDPLTEGLKPTSKVIGRAQGMYGSADQAELGLLMTLTYSFTDGEFKGSTLSVLGRNPVFHPVREMAVVGGTGAFRFARGYALARTRWLSPVGDVIVEYNVTVVH